MRATILPYAITLTMAHRAMVSMMAKGCIELWPEYCLLGAFYFYCPTICKYNATDFIS